MRISDWSSDVCSSDLFYSKHGIQLLDATVEAIDRSAGSLSLSTGDALTYDKLALCTGARPRRLPTPGADLAGVYYLRTAADVGLIRKAATPGRRAVIVGGGYIGLETAASLRALGLEVTVLEATERVLERDRKSVVEGKSVSVRVDLGGLRIIKKKK